MLDGVIKYHVSHSQGEAPHFAGYAGLEALRARLFALGLIGETSDGIGYGNISQRTGEHSFFITATQTGKQPALTPGKGDATLYYNRHTQLDWVSISEQSGFPPLRE